MPILKIEMFAGRTPEQKAEFAKEVTQLATRVLRCPAETVDVIFVDIATADWAHGGKLYCSD